MFDSLKSNLHIKRKKSGELVLSFQFDFLDHFFKRWSNFSVRRWFLTGVIGLGLGIGLSVSLMPAPTQIQAELPQPYIAQEAIPVSRITFPESDQAYIVGQGETKAPAKQRGDYGSLGTPLPIAIELSDPSFQVEKVALGNKIIVTGKNNGLYTFSLIEVRKGSLSDLKNNVAANDSVIIIDVNHGWLTSDHTLLVARQTAEI